MKQLIAFFVKRETSNGTRVLAMATFSPAIGELGFDASLPVADIVQVFTKPGRCRGSPVRVKARMRRNENTVLSEVGTEAFTRTRVYLFCGALFTFLVNFDEIKPRLRIK